MNYLLLGLGPDLDRFYLHSFEILLACTVVFPGIGNLGYTLLEVRLGQRNFFAAMFENLRWIPFLWVFGISFTFFVCGDWLCFINLVCSSLVAWVYICLPLCWRICSPMTCMCLLPACLTLRNLLKWKLFSRTWGSTGKEVERSSFWIEGGFFLLCRQVLLLTSDGLVFDLISPSHLATLQAVLHHLLRSYRHDDYFYYQCRTFWVADSRMELGLDYSIVTCCGMSYSFTRKSDSLFIYLVKEWTIN
jgi:hypothetical protein